MHHQFQHPRGTLLKRDVLAALKSGKGSTNISPIKKATPSPPQVDQQATPRESPGLKSDGQQKGAYEDLPNSQICKENEKRREEKRREGRREE
ncbi:hypothetical protein RND71_030126 [Anisodus tanguticus]|uniref:Uncharacterized protein n=1 Tax=Anisodus tanguticus TaxID=243964 RepID=A0AAE1UZD6_9SOLA|nr:hypothetical protein RND71_030126 [Anisodus tanguticus]